MYDKASKSLGGGIKAHKIKHALSVCIIFLSTLCAAIVVAGVSLSAMETAGAVTYNHTYYTKFPIYNESSKAWQDVVFKIESDSSSGGLVPMDIYAHMYNTSVYEFSTYSSGGSVINCKITFTKNATLCKNYFYEMYLAGGSIYSFYFNSAYQIYNKGIYVTTTSESDAETLHFTIEQKCSTKGGLEWFRDQVNIGYTVRYVLLKNDIDLLGTEWTPIGVAKDTSVNSKSRNIFNGTFNGGGYYIKNFKITNGPEYSKYLLSAGSGYGGIGLFSFTEDATIMNLAVSDFTINVQGSGHDYNHWGDFIQVGGIVGLSISDLTMDNCAVINASIKVTGNNSKDFTTGGIIGLHLCSDNTSKLTITNCMTNNLSLTINEGWGFTAGGLIGGISQAIKDKISNTTACEISKCYVSASLNTTNSSTKHARNSLYGFVGLTPIFKVNFDGCYERCTFSGDWYYSYHFMGNRLNNSAAIITYNNCYYNEGSGDVAW